MPANLVPHASIPDLAAKVSSDMLEVLYRIQKAGFIMNDKSMDPKTAGVLQQLTELALIDPAYEADTSEPPSMWVSNGNGSRVLNYRTGIRAGPFYEISAAELAAWLEEQGESRWWNVDGDPLLTGRIAFPCPASELAKELRKIDRPLLVQAKKGDVTAKGQSIGKVQLNKVVGYFAENLYISDAEQKPPWSRDRFFYLCWKGMSSEWLLAEDSETTEQYQADEAATTK